MIKIIAVGKVKEKFYREAILEYQKRLSKYTKVEIIEVPDIDAETKEIELRKEKEFILKNIKEREYLVTLEIEGKEMDSLTFSSLLEKNFSLYPTITFIIGGSVGIHSSIKEMAHFKLSFSKMTFPHQLFRVLLLEQIYRAYKIQNHESYHK